MEAADDDAGQGAAADPAPAGAAGGGDGDDGGRRDRWLLLGGWAALVVVHLWASWGVGGPTVAYDENGYLGNARWLAGGTRWDMPRSPAYAVGYPLLLTPAMVLFDSAQAQWRAVLTVNALLLASVFPLLAAVLRRLLDRPLRAVLVPAAVGALAPAVLAAGVSAIAENLALPLVLVVVLTAWAVTDPDRTAGRSLATRLGRYGFGPAVAALYVTHTRFVALLVLAVAALAVGARTGTVRPRVAAGNVALLAAVAAVGTVLGRAARRARWQEVENLEGGPSAWLDLLGTGEGLGELALTATGQLWYLAVGTLGLVAVAVAALVRLAAAGRSPGGRSATDPDPARRARALVAGFTLAAGGAVFAVSVVFFALNQFRPDHWVYGRHNDSFAPLWIGLAVAVLAPIAAGTAARRARLVELATGAGVVAVGGALLVATRDPSELDTGFSPFAVPAVIRHVAAGSDGTFPRATAFGLVAVAVVAAVAVASWRAAAAGGALRRPVAVAAVPLLVASWFTYAGLGTVEGTIDFQRVVSGEEWTAPDHIERLGITTLEIEGRTARGIPTLIYPFRMPDVEVRTYEAGAGDTPVGPYVLARLDDPFRPRDGDRVVLFDQGGFYWLWDAPVGLAVWVRPGPEQDRLAARGLLLPDRFPAPLPPEARRAEVAIADAPDGPLVVDPGGRLDLAVTVRHAGTGSPWPDQASFAGDGRVQVVATVVAVDGDPAEGPRSATELTGWVDPGGSVRARAEAFALDTFLQPLDPGRYRVVVGVGQAGEGWFAPAAEHEVVVRG